jgi:hypothetical protein
MLPWRLTFFVNKIPFFIIYPLVICFLSVTHLSYRKALTIFDALKSMCSYYLQQGFQIVFIKGDGEFALLEAWMATVYGAPKLNLGSANKHVPEIERKIQVFKERVRAVIYSIPFNSLPAQMQVHAVLFVTKQLNLFPVKGGLSSKLSPKQIMSGKVVSTISSVRWVLVGINFAPANDGNVEPPLFDIPPPVNDAPVVSKVPTDGGTRRSTCIRMQPKPQYVPAFSGKTYSFATTVLGTKMLDNVAYGYNQSVAFSFMQQLLVKSALREWGDDARAAGEKEVNQLHWRETFLPRQMSELTAEQ